MTQSPDIVKGSLYALAAFFCMAVFGILTKLALQDSSVIWVSFITYLTGACALIPYIVPKGIEYLKSERYGYLLGRAIFGCLASFLFTIAIRYIPIVNGTLLFNTAPIFIPILALLFWNLKVEKRIWLAVAIGFIGIAMIIRPTQAILTQPGNVIGLVSGLSLAIAYLLMKRLTDTDPGIRIIFYYLGIGMLIQIPLLFLPQSLPTQAGIFYAILSGTTLLTAQLALARAYIFAEAAQVGIYQYTTVAFVGLFEWLIFNHIPSLWDMVGVCLVALAGVIIIRGANQKKIP
jgi:drug/metabolite transporter (DMT)-like permease